ncbi:31959_t:CDS:1 [Gigaspora margarita]|uniref:31959_t:CDS:1 n=2 Tax=Gigaspora margarita TaxID=4874 RepID=A0ABN7UWC1_GIGMA|nr:MATA-HMG [Gigaspora margarita]CAG8685881.1 31959_t:CDS:1 [Gigaspora margarita]
MSEYSANNPQQVFTETRPLSVSSPRKENINKSSENINNASASMSSSNNVATGCDQEPFIPQLPQPQYKTSKGGNPVPSFEYLSYDRVQDLYEQNKGTLYFIPEGFEPVLVPNDAKATSVTNLLENAKPVSAAPNVPRMLPDTDVRLPSFALPCGVAGPTPKTTSTNSKTKIKKPPRPPNAFILYRRAKQPGIVAKNQGITNNEVSKEIGRMWHEEPQEVRSKFQKMADAAKQEHMKKYPEYRYRPRRPQERKRRIQPREDSPSAQGSTPTSQNLSMIDASAFFPRRVSSISTDGENSEIFTPTSMLNHNINILQHPQQQHLLYAESPLNGSPQQYLDSTMAKYDYQYDSNSYDGSPVSTAGTTFVNPPMTTSGGMIDFNVFDASNPPAPGEAMEYFGMGDYIDAYDQYESMASLNFISAADEQFIRNQQQHFVKLDSKYY